MSAARHLFAPLALFGLALLVRVSSWREVIGGQHVLPVGSDAFYHLRRIVFAVFRHPETLAFDPYIAYPTGAKPIWTPLFDSGIAALLRPFVPPLNEGGQAAVEAWAVWVPPLLGALGVVATFGLARRHYGQRVAAVAGTSLALVSGHFWYSQIGFIDHHAAVALAAVLLLAGGLALVAAHEDRARGRLGVAAAVFGVLAATSLMLWPGCLLHLSLVELGLLGVLLAEHEAGRARSLALALAGAHALGLVLLAPSGLASDWPQWSAYSPVVLSRFQPWLLAIATAVLGSCVLLWRSGFGETRARRVQGFAALALVALAASFGLVAGLREGAQDAWLWLGKGDAFQARVAESFPLLFEGGRFTLTIAVARLSPFFLVLPLAALWLLWRERGRETFARSVLVVLFTLGLLTVTLLQKRFFNSASVGLALVLALVVSELLKLAGERRGLRTVAWLALGACLLPTVTPYARYLANEVNVLRGRPVAVTGVYAAQRAVVETTSWLRAGTPPTSGWLRSDAEPEYGVLAPWPLGHAIEYVGRRPTLVDNFGDDLGEEAFRFADAFYRSPEPQVARAAREQGVRYVVAQRGEGFLSRPPPPGNLLHALFLGDGAGGEDASGRPLARLEQHRLLFESGGLRWKDPEAESLFKVFELVPGAWVAGRAAPGREIALRLGVVTNRGRRFFYEAHAVADAEGGYRVRVPYATQGGPEGVRVAPLYRLKCGEEVRGVAVPEEAVGAGQTVQAPPLCLETS